MRSRVDGTQRGWRRWSSVALVACAACGPSFQAVHEGNARFERCYATEEDPRRTADDKAACWREWSERYTYGQTQDRIDYATSRYVILTGGFDGVPRQNIQSTMRRRSAITAPAPTSPDSPPPKVLDLRDGGAP